jgi:uncharacterized membrane protein YbaN (DUF454 family)
MTDGLPDPERTRPGRRSAAALWRPALFVLGWIFVGLGVAGVVLPLVPGTLFLIIAAACFTRSSPRFEAWLVNHRRLGPPIRTWRESRAIPRPVKVYACVSLVPSWLLLLATDAPNLIKVGCLFLFVAVGLFIATRPDG